MNQGIFDKIFAKIKWLRTQPENVKVRYIWVSAFVIFAIVALLWVGLFRKYERKTVGNGKGTEVILEEGKKIKDDLGSKIKDIKLPEMSPLISPSVSPLVSPETSPTVSPEASPLISPSVSPSSFASPEISAKIIPEAL